MALVLKEREAEAAAGRSKDLEMRGEERKRFTAREDAIGVGNEVRAETVIWRELKNMAWN